MRSIVFTRALVSVGLLAGITAGGMAIGSPSYATTHAIPAADSATAAAYSVVNLGLSIAEAKQVQIFLAAEWGYLGTIDGQLGGNSWKALQRMLRYYGYTGPVDGIVGGGTVSALQRLLRQAAGYTGAIDGIAGPQTQAAFRRFSKILFPHS